MHRDGVDAVARTALRARWHLAVLDGPDPGWCFPVHSRAQVVGRDADADLHLADPLCSRRHLEVRERRGVVQVRDLASANGTRRRQGRATRSRRTPGRRVGRRVGQRWTPLAEGAELAVGASVLRVRRRPGLGPPPPAHASDGREGPVPAESVSPGRLLTSILLAASSLPMLLAMGVSGTRLALVALVPLALLAAGLAPWLRRLLRRRHERPTPRDLDPAALLLIAASEGCVPDGAVDLPDSTSADPFGEGALALVGDGESVRAAARWLVCQLAARHPSGELAIRTSTSSETGPWRWIEALPHSARQPAGAPPDRRLTVIDAVEPGPVLARPALGDPAHGVVVLVAGLTHVPPWCARVVEVSLRHNRRVSTQWARAVARELAARDSGEHGLPRDVPITGLLETPEIAWADPDDALASSFSVGTDGPITLDLARDGPHALVAGTTGSGKSELLLCWLLALACRYPPSALAIVAIDYKGGATFGVIATLPHVAGVLTDLDAPATARALAGLRAELARRERLLADAGTRDLADYRRLARDRGWEPIGRLLVMVDEFRTLADEHPELLAGLVRIAAQGRSLGIHLVLATQRPAGAISADMRANLSVTICLRVLSAADSLDVLGRADAARLPSIPGRAVLTTDGSVEIQAAWCGPETGGPETAGAHRGGTLGDVVREIRMAAAARGDRHQVPLWAPTLPDRIEGSAAHEDLHGLPVLVTDRIETQQHVVWAWSPERSPLLVVGGPGTGRTTALLTVARGALSRGTPVHVVAGIAGPFIAGLAGHRLLGTVVGADDPRRLVRLLALLADSGGPALVCIDGIDAVVEACDRIAGPGFGHEHLVRLLRDARAHGLAIAMTGPATSLTARWATGVRHRIVLAPRDSGEAALAGVPRHLLGGRWPAGRGVLLGDGAAVIGQVLLARTLRPSPEVLGVPGPPRLAAIPLRVDPTLLTQSGGESASGRGAHVVLGIGGDTAGAVWLDVGPGARITIAGPAESGRTAALVGLAERLRSRGMRVTWVDPSRAGRSERATTFDPTTVDTATVNTTDETPDEGDREAVLIDDADALPLNAAESLARRWQDGHGVMIAATRSDALGSAYRGLLAQMREARTCVVLGPLWGGSAHLPPGDVLPHADPAHPRSPGRGVVVTPRRAVPVQLPAPGPEA